MLENQQIIIDEVTIWITTVIGSKITILALSMLIIIIALFLPVSASIE